MHTNQTGTFPVTSSKGNKNMMVIYSYDTNKILVHTMKTRKRSEIAQAYEKIFKQLTANGFRPIVRRISNKASVVIKHFDRNYFVEFQLVPPYKHSCNPREKSICMWKDKYIWRYL